MKTLFAQRSPQRQLLADNAISRNRLAMVLIGVVASFCSLQPAAHAVVSTWTSGATSANWSTAANWDNALATSGTLVFGNSSYSVINNDQTAVSAFNQILFAGATTSSYVISGNALTLGTSTASTIISNASKQTQTINNNIALGSASQTVNLTSGGGNVVLGGTISGAGSLNVTGAGKLVLSGTANSFTGGVTLNTGATVVAGKVANGGSVSSIGSSSSSASNLVFAGDSTLRILNSGTTDRNFIIADGATATIDLSGTGASGTSIISVLFKGGATGTNGLSTGGLTKLGIGTLTLTGTQGYTGATTIGAGTLALDYSATGAPATNIINSNSSLVLNGGSLQVKGKASTTNSQTFNGLTVGSGGSKINVTGSTSSVVTLALGNITRSTGGTLNFNTPSVGGTTITTTASNDSTGILGPWATVGSGASTYYAAVTGGSIVAYTGATSAATAADLTDTTGTANYDLVSAAGTIASSVSVNTIRNTGAAATSAVTSTLTVNGLMQTASGMWTIGSAANSGTITIGSSKELVVYVGNSSGIVKINTAIADSALGASALTIDGVNASAVVYLYGTNSTFSGPVNINNAALALSGAVSALGNSTEINLNGGVLSVMNGAGVNLIGNRTINVGTSGGTLSTNPGNTMTVSGAVNINGTFLTLKPAATTGIINITGVISGSGGIYQTSTGVVNLSNANDYRGETVLNGGILNIRNSNALGSLEGATTVVNGTLQLQDNINVAEELILSSTSTYTAAVENVSGNNTYSGNITVNSTSTVTPTITADAGSSLAVTGNVNLVSSNLLITGAGNTTVNSSVGNGISGNGNLTKEGTGTLKFAGKNTYTGSTTVTSGTLIVSGSLTATSSVSNAAGTVLSVEGGGINGLAAITSAGTVQGRGEVGALNISAGGILAPGKTTETVQTMGTLTAHGNVTFATGATSFNIKVGQTYNDKLIIADGGSLTLNNVALSLDLSSYNFTTSDIGSKFTIVSGGASQTGVAYNNIFSQGSLYTAENGNLFQVYYASAVSGNTVVSGNDIVLEFLAVPEPSTWGLIATGFGMLLGASRLRRNRR